MRAGGVGDRAAGLRGRAELRAAARSSSPPRSSRRRRPSPRRRPGRMVAALPRPRTRSARRDGERNRTRTSGKPSPASIRPGALARVAASFLLPTVTADPATRACRALGQPGQRDYRTAVEQSVAFNDWQIPFDLTYEIDVWGRVRRSVEASNAQAAASRRRPGGRAPHGRDRRGHLLLHPAARLTPRSRSSRRPSPPTPSRCGSSRPN